MYFSCLHADNAVQEFSDLCKEIASDLLNKFSDISLGERFLFLAFDAADMHKPIGFLNNYRPGIKKDLFIAEVYVIEQQQRTGYGGAMVNSLKE